MQCVDGEIGNKIERDRRKRKEMVKIRRISFSSEYDTDVVSLVAVSI